MIPGHVYCIYWDTIRLLDAETTARAKVPMSLVGDIEILEFYSHAGFIESTQGK
jgi:hypothetical protein